jgi:hypothetical protein
VVELVGWMTPQPPGHGGQSWGVGVSGRRSSRDGRVAWRDCDCECGGGCDAAARVLTSASTWVWMGWMRRGGLGELGER